MELDRKIAFVFGSLGLIAGSISASLGELILSIVAGAAIYGVALFFSLRKIRNKKQNWVVAHTLATFALVWIVFWTLLFNLGA